MSRGNLFVISGPSGAGKGTLVSRLVQEVPDAWLSISATTRTPRPGDIEGQTYFFLDKEDFLRRAEAGEFLEWAEYSGNCYGTPLKSVQDAIAQGKQVILEIDVQGALQIKEKMPEAILIFIEPPSMEELRRRLEGRGTEDPETIERRMAAAELEISAKEEYDYQLVNDDLDEAVRELVSFVNEKADETRG